jgi:hypothetical protein
VTSALVKGECRALQHAAPTAARSAGCTLPCYTSCKVFASTCCPIGGVDCRLLCCALTGRPQSRHGPRPKPRRRSQAVCLQVSPLCTNVTSVDKMRAAGE